jgi:hypothetical protein
MSKPLADGFRPYLPPVIGTSLAASLAAFIATMTITAGFFGEIRLVGIVCGLFMGPLSTVFMIGAIAFPVLPPFLKIPVDGAMSLVYAVLEKIAFTAGRAPPIALTAAPALVINFALVAGLVALTLGIIKKRYRFDRTQLEL